MEKDWTGTTMRVAGNIAAGLVQHPHWAEQLGDERRELGPVMEDVAIVAAGMAQAIVQQVLANMAEEAAEREAAQDAARLDA